MAGASAIEARSRYARVMELGSVADWLTGILTAAGVLAAVIQLRSMSYQAISKQASQVMAACRMDKMHDGEWLVSFLVENNSDSPIFNVQVSFTLTKPGQPLEGPIGIVDGVDGGIGVYRLSLRPASRGRMSNLRKIEDGRYSYGEFIITPWHGEKAHGKEDDSFQTLPPRKSFRDTVTLSRWGAGVIMLRFTDGHGSSWSRNLVTHKLYRLKSPSDLVVMPQDTISPEWENSAKRGHRFRSRIRSWMSLESYSEV